MADEDGAFSQRYNLAQPEPGQVGELAADGSYGRVRGHEISGVIVVVAGDKAGRQPRPGNGSQVVSDSSARRYIAGDHDAICSGHRHGIKKALTLKWSNKIEVEIAAPGQQVFAHDFILNSGL